MTKSFVRIETELVRRIDNAGDTLVRKILPPILRQVVPRIRSAIIGKLPDGQASGTRAKQTAKVAAAFPKHMKDHVEDKQIADSVGVLQLVGVSSSAKQVNFDHGEKALSTGRRHILWWPKARTTIVAKNGRTMTLGGEPTRVHDPEFRKQMHDIPLEVNAEIGPEIERFVTQKLVDAISAGGL